ncbi:MAG: hypothetical protein AVDCRST_MAG20-2296, partial [uncultured Acidimicrobiales bacterium]
WPSSRSTTWSRPGTGCPGSACGSSGAPTSPTWPAPTSTPRTCRAPSSRSTAPSRPGRGAGPGPGGSVRRRRIASPGGSGASPWRVPTRTPWRRGGRRSSACRPTGRPSPSTTRRSWRSWRGTTRASPTCASPARDRPGRRWSAASASTWRRSR